VKVASDDALSFEQAVCDEDGLPEDIAELIEADVARTYPTSLAFMGSGGPGRLRRVLRVLVVSDEQLGYCQSMNFIAAMFVMVLRDERAALAAFRQLLVKLGTRCWYTNGMTQLRADTLVLDGLLRERLPPTHKALHTQRFDLLFVSSKWFLCLFSTVLEGEALRRVWDVVICDGIEAVFRIAIALLARCAKLVMIAKSHDDLVQMFQTWQLDCSPEVLIQSAYSSALMGSISRAELAQRRRQAAVRISTDDTRTEMRTSHLRRGGVRPASILAR